MSAKLTEFYRLKYLDFSCYDLVAPYGVLDVFQDIAGKHSESYGMSFGEMIANNKIWVLLRVKYKVVKNIPLYAPIKATTWPRKKGLVDFDRETQITSIDGDVYINGISKWVVVDYNSRRIIPAKHIEYNAETSDDTNFDDKFDRVKDFSIEGLTSKSYKVEFCDTDHNGHTNNAKYATMIINTLRLNESEQIDEFQLDFVNETRLDDVVDVYVKKEENTYYAKAICNEKVVFLSKINLK